MRIVAFAAFRAGRKDRFPACGAALIFCLLLGSCGPTLRYTSLRLSVVRSGENARRYLVIHGNEHTAKDALRAHLRRTGGVGYIVKTKSRTFLIDSLRADPNRIFSHAGAEANLRLLNPQAPAESIRRALVKLDGVRAEFVAALLPPKGGLLVAIHNNREGYSIHDEIPISDRVSLKRPAEPHEFFLATDPRDFEILERSPYNAVLQFRAPPHDDGSLSRLAAATGLRYINLEVGIGKLQTQIEMLRWAEENLPAFHPSRP